MLVNFLLEYTVPIDMMAVKPATISTALEEAFVMNQDKAIGGAIKHKMKVEFPVRGDGRLAIYCTLMPNFEYVDELLYAVTHLASTVMGVLTMALDRVDLRRAQIVDAYDSAGNNITPLFHKRFCQV